MRTLLLTVMLFCAGQQSAFAEQSGELIWESAPWTISRAYRNGDTTDPGCRLTLQQGKASLVLESYFLFGRVAATWPGAAMPKAEGSLRLYEPISDTVLTNSPATFEGEVAEGKAGGQTIDHALTAWAGTGAKELLVIDPSDKPVMRFETPALTEAARQFATCFAAI